MKFSTAFAASTFAVSLGVSAFPIQRRVDPNLIPPFGFNAGVNPTGTGDCDGAVKGANGLPIKIPCTCPPDRNSFIDLLNANVAAGHATNNPSVAVSFPTSNSQADQIARIQTALVTLQNLRGPGQGCPAVSTTFLAQQAAVQAGAPAPAPAAAAPAPAPVAAAAAPAPAAGGVDVSLIPDFGFSAGVNPTGTGDCDGAVKDANGVPIKVPCSCPPDRNSFIASLNANVAAGHATNNPSVAVSFPTSNSNADKVARIQTALVTLQNLRGPGQGCPAASTTLLAQQKAITG